jgi:uncharacterized protein YlaI
VKLVYRQITDISRPCVGPLSLRLKPIKKYSVRSIEARVRTEWQLECGHWTFFSKDSYQSRKHGVDMYFCRQCTDPITGDESGVNMTDLCIDQEMAVDALVRMLEELGFKIEKP